MTVGSISNQERIIAAIRSTGRTLLGLDRELRLPAGATSAAIQKPYHKAEQLISSFLEIPAASLWPERYNSDGSRKRPQPQANYKPRRRFTKQAKR